MKEALAGTVLFGGTDYSSLRGAILQERCTQRVAMLVPGAPDRWQEFFRNQPLRLWRSKDRKTWKDFAAGSSQTA